jgi:mono/diheme cytochrome c family protein
VPSVGMPTSFYSPSKGCNDRDLGQVDQIPILLIAVSLMALTTLLACGHDRLLEEVPPTATVEGRPLEELSPERRGDALYPANCQACHGSQQGEGLTAGAPPHNDIGHTWHHPDA